MTGKSRLLKEIAMTTPTIYIHICHHPATKLKTDVVSKWFIRSRFALGYERKFGSAESSLHSRCIRRSKIAFPLEPNFHSSPKRYDKPCSNKPHGCDVSSSVAGSRICTHAISLSDRDLPVIEELYLKVVQATRPAQHHRLNSENSSGIYLRRRTPIASSSYARLSLWTGGILATPPTSRFTIVYSLRSKIFTFKYNLWEKEGGEA